MSARRSRPPSRRPEVLLGSMAWPDVRPAVLLVPLGSCEQHGPHLPLDTDSRIAETVARTAAARPEAAPVVVAPTLGYGASGEHQDFPGTLSIGTAALETVLVELGRSATAAGFTAVVFVCGHGGNAPAVQAATELLRAEGRRASVWFPAVPGGDAHAGRTETSLILALASDLVGTARPVGNTEPLEDLLPRLVQDGVRAHAPDGVLGDATEASRHEGYALLVQLVESLERHIASVTSA